MPFDARFLLSPPPLFLGAFAVLAVVLALTAVTRSWRAVLAALVGAGAGYFLLGTALGFHLADEAVAEGRCPDAGWQGPAVGAFFGSGFAVLLFLALRLRRRPSV